MRRLVVGMAIVIAGLSPSWTRADDQEIAQQIVQRLNDHKEQGRLKGFNIDMQVDQGTVWLKGHVSNPAQLQTAVDAARSVEDVRQVVNDLAIQEPVEAAQSVDNTRPDAAQPVEAPTEAQPESQTAERPASSEERLPTARKPLWRTVRATLSRFTETDSAVRQASATEPTPVERQEAATSESQERRSSQQAQPDSRQPQPVENEAAAESEAQADVQIAQQIIQHLHSFKNQGLLKGFEIDLRVEDRTVWLEGELSSAEQLQLVLETTRRVSGVKQVVNQLSLPQWSSQPLRAKMQMAVARQPVADQQASAPASPSTEAEAAPANKLSDPVAPATPAGSQNPQQYQIARPPMYGYPAPYGYPAMAYNPASPANFQQPANFQPQPDASAMVEGGTPQHDSGLGMPVPAHMPSAAGTGQTRYDHPVLPGYAWPSYASYPNYAAVTYPKQYSPSAWPYIGPFYPYPQVPLGWRKVALEWDDGWWMLDFKSK